MRIFFILLLSLCALTSSAQYYNWEFGGGLGTSNYFGDIGGVSFDGRSGPADVMLNTTRFNMAVFGRRYLDYRFYINVQASFLNIKGDDKLSPSTGRESRNLNFENNIFEGSAMLEFHPLIINDLGGKKRHIADLHLLIGTGLGVIYSDPYSMDGGNKTALRPLATEGLQNKYSPIQMVLPVATGVFVSFKGRYSGYRVHRFGISINYRFAFTDYLDDVSTVYPDYDSFYGDQARIEASWKGWRERDPSSTIFPEGGIRGNPKRNDGYLTTMIYYSKRISSGRKKHKLPRRMEFYGRSKRGRFK